MDPQDDGGRRRGGVSGASGGRWGEGHPREHAANSTSCDVAAKRSLPVKTRVRAGNATFSPTGYAANTWTTHGGTSI